MAESEHGTLEVHVVTPEREVWSGEATIVVARAVDGDVGILPGHAPLVAALQVGALYIEPVGGPRIAAAVDGGFLHVVSPGNATRVDILAEHAELAQDVPAGEAAALERRAAELRDAHRYAEARSEFAKALTRQRITTH
jgi:F-type H+-transporting ATPase subunit epsilon